LILKHLFVRPVSSFGQETFIGADGIFTTLLKHIPEASLEGELDSELVATRKTSKNPRIGHIRKKIQSLLVADVWLANCPNGTYKLFC
jgi:hypothetical protein